MPRRKVLNKRRVYELSNDQMWELLLGAGGDASNFESPAAKREAYWLHRDELMECGNCVRPNAWWLYEAQGRREPHEGHLEALVRLHEATPEEVAEFRRHIVALKGRLADAEKVGVKPSPFDLADYERQSRLLTGAVKA